MPLFFFHVRGAHQELSGDDLGLEFPNVETVYFMTLCAAWVVGAEFAACGLSLRDWSIGVSNAADELLFTFVFAEALHRLLLTEAASECSETGNAA